MCAALNLVCHKLWARICYNKYNQVAKIVLRRDDVRKTLITAFRSELKEFIIWTTKR